MPSAQIWCVLSFSNNTSSHYPVNNWFPSQANPIPTGFKKASDINSAGDLPYISKNGLLTAKLVSCHERTKDDKATKDAKDAKHIVDTDGDVGLTEDQKKTIVDGGCMNTVFEKTDTDAEWWAEKAGLTGLVGDDAEDEQEDAAEDAEDAAEDAEEKADDDDGLF